MGNSVSTSGGGQQVSPPPDRTAQPAALPLTEELLKKHVAAGSDEEEVSGCAALAARGGRATPGGVGPPPARCCCFWQCFVLGYCRLPRAAGLRWGCVCCRAAPQPGFRAAGMLAAAMGLQEAAGGRPAACRCSATAAASGPHAAAAASGARAGGVSDRFSPIAGLLQCPPPALLVHGPYPFWLHLKARNQAPPPACPPLPLMPAGARVVCELAQQ